METTSLRFFPVPNHPNRAAGDPAHADADELRAPLNLVGLLHAEHAEIRSLLDAFETLVDDGAGAAQRQQVAEAICLALAAHAVLEDEIVYPIVRALPGCGRATAEAEVEHAAARVLIDQIMLMNPDDPMYDAHVSVLGEYVRHHLEQEEALLLPDLLQSDLDLPALGRQALRRRQALQLELDAMGGPA